MRLTFACLLMGFMLVPAPLRAESVTTEHYDLLFKLGTLDDVPNEKALVYARDVTNTLAPDAAERDTGEIELGFAGGEPPKVRLKFTQGEKYRNLGQFPANVGNPIILYFVETVIRDMAETAGGSPFYIRNRIKESLVEPGLLEIGEAELDGTPVTTQAVTLHPFDGDPNIDRMKGFGLLELEVTMSDEVPGWYHTLRATVPDPDGETPIYSSTLTFRSSKVLQ